MNIPNWVKQTILITILTTILLAVIGTAVVLGGKMNTVIIETKVDDDIHNENLKKIFDKLDSMEIRIIEKMDSIIEKMDSIIEKMDNTIEKMDKLNRKCEKINIEIGERK